jgi:hypothetical protein
LRHLRRLWPWHGWKLLVVVLLGPEFLNFRQSELGMSVSWLIVVLLMMGDIVVMDLGQFSPRVVHFLSKLIGNVGKFRELSSEKIVVGDLDLFDLIVEFVDEVLSPNVLSLNRLVPFQVEAENDG